ncbi:MAG: thioredoxin family protein [Sulfuricurvum sp.]
MRQIITTLFCVAFVLQGSLFARNIDINAIVKNSVKSNKHLFIFLHRTDCGYCESMLTFTLDDDPVKERIRKNFSYLHINISEDDHITYKNFRGNGREFAKHVGYNIYPSSLFLNSKNDIVYAISGYQEKEKFLEILKCVDSRSYKKMDCEAFDSKINVKKP